MFNRDNIRAGGVKELLILAFPLIITTGTWSLQQFIDRIFLAWYSPEAIAAAMPAGFLNFTITSIFMGTVNFLSTFAAQYYGANEKNKISPVIWQGFYLAILAAIVEIALIPLAPFLFRIIGHSPAIQPLEVRYFQMLCLGAAPSIAASAISSFFSGIGRPWPIMWVNVIVLLVNVVFDYLLIFGKFGFPEMGITGAGLATVLSFVVNLGVYLWLIAASSLKNEFNFFGNKKFNWDIIKRIFKFGLPNGINFFIDVTGMTIFILLMGRLGMDELAATNIAFNINTIAFMPMLGIGIGVSILVGQRLGEGNPHLARKSTWSGFWVAFSYMLIIASLYFFLPEPFINLYIKSGEAERFAHIKTIGIILLKFVAVYSIFDTMNIIFSSALRGAGDTKFIMYMIAFLSLFIIIIPGFIGIKLHLLNVYSSWLIISLYFILLGVIFFIRFMAGHWEKMLVIEKKQS